MIGKRLAILDSAVVEEEGDNFRLINLLSTLVALVGVCTYFVSTHL